jgi:hypothetical protein
MIFDVEAQKLTLYFAVRFSHPLHLLGGYLPPQPLVFNKLSAEERQKQ